MADLDEVDHKWTTKLVMGHTSITLTLDTYSHVLPGMQDELAKQLNAMLFQHKITGSITMTKGIFNDITN